MENNSKVISEILEKKIRLTSVNRNAIKYWEDQWEELNTRSPPNGGWNWRDIFYSQNKPITRRYSLAILCEDILCGMAIGYSSKGGSHVRVDFIEGSPDDAHPLRGKILEIIVNVSMDYTRLIEKKKLIIADPVAGLVEKYKEMGFTHYRKPNSFFRKEEVCVMEVER